MVAVNPAQFVFTLVTANHILDHHQVVDDPDYISIRNPNNNTTFLMTGNLFLAHIQSIHVSNEFYTGNGPPVTAADSPGTQSPYSERFVHPSIPKRYPNQINLVHSRSFSSPQSPSLSNLPTP